MNGRIENIRVFFKDDLNPRYYDSPLSELSFDSFLVSSIKKFQTEPFVIYIDPQGNSILLKNRYGNKGRLIPEYKLVDMLTKAVNKEQHFTEHEFNNLTISEANASLINRIIKE